MNKVYVITDGSEGEVIGVASSEEIAIMFVDEYFPLKYFDDDEEARQYFLDEEVVIEPFNLEESA
jgi:hypothetical protein